MLNHVFSPISIGNMVVKNRLVVPPMVSNYANEDGTCTEQFISYHEEKAKGGWGLIIVEDYKINPEAGGFVKLPGLWDDSQIESHQQLTERVHQHGAKIAAQIYHAGRETCAEITGVQPVAPSAIPDPVVNAMPRELSVEEIQQLVEQFGDTALRAKKAGFDAVEIHGAHGYLVNQFMSPFSNKRIDQYGGTILNRARFALEIIANIRSKVGPDFPLIYRMSVNEFVEGGLTTEDSKVISMLLENAGIDLIHASNGVYASTETIIPPTAVGHAWSANISEELKKVVSIPVIAVGRINDPLIAESVLRSKQADMISMGRGSLADPHLPNKAQAGQFDDIIRCIGCLQGCIQRNAQQLPIKCLVNPMTGHESERQITPASREKKVFIIGGGIAGMEAAIVAAQRGHKVEIFEKNSRLGGQWVLAAIPPTKEELGSFTVWQVNQLNKLGVIVHLNTELTLDMIRDNQPDSVIIATGASPFVPNIPGKDLNHVLTANDILQGSAQAGKRVVVIGGGLVGSETAAHLANHGHDVSIIEMNSDIFVGTPSATKQYLMKDLQHHNVAILTNTQVKEIHNDAVVVENDGQLQTLAAIDNVVMAIGSRPVSFSVEDLEQHVSEIVTIGDAQKVRKAMEAVEEGYLAGLSL
ncbi:FAD-dependent oxidoreductase [Vibrio natriegens]|jgi:2,4-dienoyl-CoA reductase-like NADH-dependent reductase (Old Yellow Enzyme family)/thioredoxin reductase|uniref:oxidoreductase n=1 Tax=Vibrio natriegens TaxID=691 RepID=UPI00228520BE|nr:FAD-dependent oxidoreductase [Vibrio natriegens]MCY9877065.1 FAD-dependent oxidoreductase [Vibrio natriegens]